MLAWPMPPDVPVWAVVAIAGLSALNLAMAIFEVVFGRPSWLRRLLTRRGRLPATARDWRLHGAVVSLASGGVILLAVGQLVLGLSTPSPMSAWPVPLALAIGLLALLIFGAASVVYLRVEYRPRPGADHG